MASHFNFVVVSDKSIDITILLHAIGVASKNFKDRTLSVNSMNVDHLDQISAMVSVNEPPFIRIGQTIFPNDLRVSRTLSVMTNVLDETLSVDDIEYSYVPKLFSGHILTSTRIEDELLDSIDFFKSISEEINTLLKDQNIVTMYSDDRIDTENKVLISGDLRTITKEE